MKARKRRAPLPWWVLPTALGSALASFTYWAWAPRDAPEPNVREGNALFARRDFPGALGHYEAAPGDGPLNAGVHMNRGLARYRIALSPADAATLPEFDPDAAVPEGYDQAQDELRGTLRGMPGAPLEDIETGLRARAAYNLANTYFSRHLWQSAIDTYKEALRLRPGWTEAAWNLELARLRKEAERQRDSGADAAQDSSPPDASQDASRDAQQDTGSDGSGGDSGAPQRGDGGSQSDGGSPSSPDGGGDPDAGSQGQDASAPPPQTTDGGPPMSLAPLDQLERNAQDLQQMLLRRRAQDLPRNPDDER
ncbi:MAG: tetratricopeptide repeat protein [Deltaproteobacteria bacterium]|nr:tetratricopeptide repeat protein [Deltaproteobacteria bacterium]